MVILAILAFITLVISVFFIAVVLGLHQAHPPTWRYSGRPVLLPSPAGSLAFMCAGASPCRRSRLPNATWPCDEPVIQPWLRMRSSPRSGNWWRSLRARRHQQARSRDQDSCAREAMNISVAERAAVEAYLDSLVSDVRELADRLEVLRTGLRVPASPDRPPGQQAASLDHRSPRGAP